MIRLATHRGAVGATLAVAADDPAALPDIPAWCRMRGQSRAKDVADDGARLLRRSR